MRQLIIALAALGLAGCASLANDLTELAGVVGNIDTKYESVTSALDKRIHELEHAIAETATALEPEGEDQ